MEDTPQPHLQEPTSVHVGISVPACLIVYVCVCVCLSVRLLLSLLVAVQRRNQALDVLLFVLPLFCQYTYTNT